MIFAVNATIGHPPFFVPCAEYIGMRGLPANK